MTHRFDFDFFSEFIRIRAKSATVDSGSKVGTTERVVVGSENKSGRYFTSLELIFVRLNGLFLTVFPPLVSSAVFLVRYGQTNATFTSKSDALHTNDESERFGFD